MTGLSEDDLDPSPTAMFARWFSEAQADGQPEPEAMALATATPDAVPSVRFVLLRGFDERGFVFYTNTRSRKGGEIGTNPNASIAFRWFTVDRQVRAVGPISVVDAAESDAYFAGRPRGHQLGAWASDQSQVISGRADLELRLEETTYLFGGVDVPRPDWWGGYRVAPAEVEFWQQGENRLHDRFRYLLRGDAWEIERLSP